MTTFKTDWDVVPQGRVMCGTLESGSLIRADPGSWFTYRETYKGVVQRVVTSKLKKLSVREFRRKDSLITFDRQYKAELVNGVTVYFAESSTSITHEIEVQDLLKGFCKRMFDDVNSVN